MFIASLSHSKWQTMRVRVGILHSFFPQSTDQYYPFSSLVMFCDMRGVRKGQKRRNEDRLVGQGFMLQQDNDPKQFN